MRLTRQELADDLQTLRGSRKPSDRAFGDNVVFDENVSPGRQSSFEAFRADDDGLRCHVAGHFKELIQGAAQAHVPDTFRPVNGPALLPAIEPNQRIVRLMRIDRALALDPSIDFARLSTPTIDADIAARLLRLLNSYPGAPPAFACLKSEVADDLAAPDWLPRLIARLGLGHHAPKPGEAMHFVLMHYMVDDVITACRTRVDTPFAIPTVIDQPPGEFFFPPPARLGWGFTADLDPALGRAPVREFLHSRIVWEYRHIARLAVLTDPMPRASLATLRDAHLIRLRQDSGRATYGEAMSSAVDPE